ncbi:MAG TPA: bifunctional adenosylcobinamide kinase/adenosylcobinamide-phosphate guanylyltransferase [Chloroflexota bacterium]|nr:bifunctional adenosylcobinamide kinase/adenosylcobinamide-phosphate guanylyltransferase [Chloroflexota bacterium]
MGTLGRLILVTGPVRSGKSRFAERLAAQLANGGEVAYVATARMWDQEMAARVAAHQASRPAKWRTVEEPAALGDAVRATQTSAAVVLVESLDMWVSNRLLEGRLDVEGDDTQLDAARLAAVEEGLLAEVAGLCEGRGAHLVVVTVEAGWGVVPPYPLGRAFRDVLGRVNAALAERADAVYLLVAGLPVDVKALAARTPMEGGG